MREKLGIFNKLKNFIKTKFFILKNKNLKKQTKIYNKKYSSYSENLVYVSEIENFLENQKCFIILKGIVFIGMLLRQLNKKIKFLEEYPLTYKYNYIAVWGFEDNNIIEKNFKEKVL